MCVLCFGRRASSFIVCDRINLDKPVGMRLSLSLSLSVSRARSHLHVCIRDIHGNKLKRACYF